MPTISIERFNVIKGFGIEGDQNANAVSPRQILITRKEDLDELHIPYGGLRENVIIQGIDANDFVPGALLKINDTNIRLTFYCEPCKRIANVVPSLKSVMHRRGTLGVILNDAEIAIDDNVQCIPGRFDPIPEMAYGRFLNFVRMIPKGNVVTYKMIAQAIGVSDSFIRAMPKYIEKAVLQNPDVPVHRIIDESGALIEKYVPFQESLLKAENISGNLKGYLWQMPPLYS